VPYDETDHPEGPGRGRRAHGYRGPMAPDDRARPTRVVLADDDHRFRALVRSVLEEDGYEVVGEAADAAAARQAVVDHRPDVIILDLVMGGADGLSTVRHLLRDHPELPVIVLSSLFDPLVEQEAVRLGAWYLEKMEGIDALEQAIDGAASVRGHRPR